MTGVTHEDAVMLRKAAGDRDVYVGCNSCGDAPVDATSLYAAELLALADRIDALADRGALPSPNQQFMAWSARRAEILRATAPR